jgi:hypothetical protein
LELSSVEALRQLAPVSVKALWRMIAPDEPIFCYREKRVGPNLQVEGKSVRYSAIALIGLSCAHDAGMALPAQLDPDRLAERLSAERPATVGDLALIVWALSKARPGLVPSVLRDLWERLGSSPKSLRSVNCIDLSWLLAALCYAEQAGVSSRALGPWATAAAEALQQAQSASGLFYRFAARRRTPLRSLVSYALLIYPIHALAMYSETYAAAWTVRSATTCAERLIGLQLPDGGWPWMYHARSGRIVDACPVYSVHQHGMGPMALSGLGRVAGRDYSGAVDAGIAWLHRRNPLGIEMVDQERATIWRAQAVPRLVNLQPRLALNGFTALLFGGGLVAAGPMRLVSECRPYELGWLLYAAFGKGAHGGKQIAATPGPIPTISGGQFSQSRA